MENVTPHLKYYGSNLTPGEEALYDPLILKAIDPLVIPTSKVIINGVLTLDEYNNPLNMVSSMGKYNYYLKNKCARFGDLTLTTPFTRQRAAILRKQLDPLDGNVRTEYSVTWDIDQDNRLIFPTMVPNPENHLLMSWPYLVGGAYGETPGFLELARQYEDTIPYVLSRMSLEATNTVKTEIYPFSKNDVVALVSVFIGQAGNAVTFGLVDNLIG